MKKACIFYRHEAHEAKPLNLQGSFSNTVAAVTVSTGMGLLPPGPDPCLPVGIQNTFFFCLGTAFEERACTHLICYDSTWNELDVLFYRLIVIKIPGQGLLYKKGMLALKNLYKGRGRSDATRWDPWN